MTSPRDGETTGRRPSEAPPVIALEDEDAVDLSDLNWSDSIVFVLFWILAIVVFLQFFTRYVLNDSLGWTEEIARYLLIGLCFVGSIMATRKGAHIYIEFFYRYLSPTATRVLKLAMDLVSAFFYGALAWLSIALIQRTHHQKMVSLDLPKSIIFITVGVSLAIMAVYALINARRRWRGEILPGEGGGERI